MGVYDIKMYLIVNGDLGMTKGKMVSAASHACLKVFFDRMEYGGASTPDLHGYVCSMNDDMRSWKDGAFAKIALRGTSANMADLLEEAFELEVPHSRIDDNGVTQVEPGSMTAIAIGPIDTTREEYRGIVDKLSLLKLL